MNVRCNHCGQTFTLSPEFMIQAVAEATDRKQKSYPIECFSCRKQIKVSVARLKPFAEAAAAQPEETAGDEAATADAE